MSLWHHAVLACAIELCDKYEIKHLRHNSPLGRKNIAVVHKVLKMLNSQINAGNNIITVSQAPCGYSLTY